MMVFFRAMGETWFKLCFKDKMAERYCVGPSLLPYGGDPVAVECVQHHLEIAPGCVLTPSGYGNAVEGGRRVDSKKAGKGLGQLHLINPVGTGLSGNFVCMGGVKCVHWVFHVTGVGESDDLLAQPRPCRYEHNGNGGNSFHGVSIIHLLLYNRCWFGCRRW